MTEINNLAGNDFSIETLPKTALQAIYHAVTGKTENLQKDLKGNVLIDTNSANRLHGMMIDQVRLHPCEIDPVVTIVVKYASEQAVTYSSWERFKALETPVHDITSEITIKYEFLIRLPSTPQPQRCIISINLDSALPLIDKQRKEGEDNYHYLFMSQSEWRTVRTKIDFVDFLLAKSFLNVVDEWFATLEKAPFNRFNAWLLKRIDLLQSAIVQTGRVGMAGFLVAYAYFTGLDRLTLVDCVLATSMGLVVWAIVAVLDGWLVRRVFRRVLANVMPSVLLLSERDERAYDAIKQGRNSASVTLFNTGLSWVGSIALNIVASYLFVYLRR